MKRFYLPLLLLFGSVVVSLGGEPMLRVDFEDGTQGGADLKGEGLNFVDGLEGRALSVESARAGKELSLSEELSFSPEADFSVQFWIKTVGESASVLLSNKPFPNRSLESQKTPGWVFYTANGTWAWSMGCGNRRLTYERDNGARMPLADGKWHQLTMTYHSEQAEVRLYYDGWNAAIYSMGDSKGFDFTQVGPLVTGLGSDGEDGILPSIEKGARQLTALVAAFNALSPEPVEGDELVDLVVAPAKLFERKGGGEGVDLTSVETLRKALMKNPHTVHQVKDFMKVAPLGRLYQLENGIVNVRRDAGLKASLGERLKDPRFAIDKLAVWRRTLSADEVAADWSRDSGRGVTAAPRVGATLTSAVWNIHHGGKHHTLEKDGWDSRMRIVEMLRKSGADVVMMQETYSSGDFIAAELGYHFATTCDWDYLNQGSNISVLSRFPIKEVWVPPAGSFMNVAARVELDEKRDLWVMSNWYGMNQFPHVFEFHAERFAQAEEQPVLFGGDFNAVPHTDGGSSPASRKLLGSGFVDAYRASHPDPAKHPGPTHEEGSRIDQLYFKGDSLEHRSTEVISEWPGGFPSDHFLILSRFDLK